MAEGIVLTPLIVFGSITAIVIYIAFAMLTRKKNPFKDFKAQLLSKTVYDELKKKIDQHGTKIKKGKLLLGLNEICWIDRWTKVKGKIAISIYDPKTKEIKTTDEDVEHDFLMLRAKNKKIILRILGLRKSYYLLDATDKDKKQIYRYDDTSHRFIYPDTIDPRPFANVWVISNLGMEYIQEISMKRMNEQTLMYLENFPDKVSHLELEQAKKERISRILTDLEKGKYDEIKKADETVVS